jgi:hypothetical protein
MKAAAADERVDPAAYDDEAIRGASKNMHLGVGDSQMTDERVEPAPMMMMFCTCL